MKYYLIAGEASGDLHGSNLIRAIKKSDPEAEFRFFGGDLMKERGGTLVCHYEKLAFMGIFDVLANIRTILGNLAFCKKDILEFSPDALILIDYPGFNLRIARFAKKRGLKIYYYISPKVWAWKKSRIPKLKEYIDRIFVIFPFEVEFFRLHGIDVEYYGNPLKDAISLYKSSKTAGDKLQANDMDKRPVIALLCGSRKHEVQRCLPEMLKAAESFPDFRFIVAGVSSVDEMVYTSILNGTETGLVKNSTYALLDKSFAAIVTSGTATLETLLFKVPQVVVYKTGFLTYNMARLFIKIRFFSLVNIIAGKEVVKELLQVRLAERIRSELKKIVMDDTYRSNMINEYNKIERMIGEEGVSEKVGKSIVQLTENRL